MARPMYNNENYPRYLLRTFIISCRAIQYCFMDDNCLCCCPTLGSDDIFVRVAQSCGLQYEGNKNGVLSTNVTSSKMINLNFPSSETAQRKFSQ